MMQFGVGEVRDVYSGFQTLVHDDSGGSIQGMKEGSEVAAAWSGILIYNP